jgi:hypothetical protein
VIWRWQADETGEQEAEFRDGEGQEIGLQIEVLPTPRWPPLARR